MTLELPQALAAWRGELSLFPIELAIELGGIVRRLSSAIGAPAAARHRGDDPDGYDGIVRHGPYDRMLHSEWLYADELPDEFLRRLVMHEQLFFRMARRSPLDELLSVALFDAGPSQLGAARILHVALLIVLSRRCTSRDGVFRWGILQEHPRRTRQTLDGRAIRALLELRTPREVTDADLDEWSDLLPHGDPRHRETWLVGGDRLAQLVERHVNSTPGGRDYREAAAITIEQPIDIEDRTLSVHVRSSRGQIQKLTLQLPEERTAIRLIRDPFESEQVAAARGAAVPAPSDILFTTSADRLISRSPNGGVVVHYLSNDHTKSYPARRREPVIAAGWGRGRGGVSITIANKERRLRVGRIHRQGATQLISPAGNFRWDAHGTDSPLSPIVPTSTASSLPNDHLFLDRFGGLWMTNTAGGLAMLFASGVAAMVLHEGHPHFAKLQDDQWTIVKIDGDKPRITDRFTGRGPAAFLATSPSAKGPRQLIAALQETSGRWLVVGDDRVRINGCPDNARVIGVTSIANQGVPALVILEKDSISLIHATHYTTVFESPYPITAACVDPHGPRVAYISGNELIVRYLDRKAIAYRAKLVTS